MSDQNLVELALQARRGPPLYPPRHNCPLCKRKRGIQESEDGEPMHCQCMYLTLEELLGSLGLLGLKEYELTLRGEKELQRGRGEPGYADPNCKKCIGGKLSYVPDQNGLSQYCPCRFPKPSTTMSW